MRIARGEERSWSLAVTVAVYTAVVMTAAMGVYAVFQYFLSPGRTVLGLVVEHLSHVLILGVAIYVILYLVLLRKVVRPIGELYWKLYSFAGGDFRPATIDSDILEIREIADGINLMLAKIDRSRPEVSLSELSDAASHLRDLARKTEALDMPTRESLMDVARRIDGAAEAITVFALDEGVAEKERARAEAEAAGMLSGAGET